MVHSKPIVRSHDRLKKGVNRDPRGERFHLQGARWRFPKDLELSEVEARIGRIKELWKDLERIFETAVYVDISAAAERGSLVLEDTVAHFQITRRKALFDSGGAVSQGSEPDDRSLAGPVSQPSWLQRSIQRLGITTGPREVRWTPLALWIAGQLKLGNKPLLLPPWQELIDSVCRGNKIDFGFRCLAPLLCLPAEAQPTQTESLRGDDALSLMQSLAVAFPSIPWVLHPGQIQDLVRIHQRNAMESVELIGKIKPEQAVTISSLAPEPHSRSKVTIAESSPDDLQHSEALTKPKLKWPGKSRAKAPSFHDALRRYMEKRRADFTKGGTFDGSGHHLIGLIENVEKRQPDLALADLDLTACQKIYDFWRDRPLNLRNNEPLSKKHCSSHIGELDRFFVWLHKSSEFAWRRPEDFDLIDRKVKRLESDRRSIHAIELKTFKVEHLALLYKHASPSERLKLVWCLNCSHGAAELGRVEWGDLYLRQPHPWIKEGLTYESSESDSWCGLLRPKTDVIGWWWLWPETVRLVEWWRRELQKVLKRDLLASDRVLLTSTGEPLYRDSSRNAQTSFANQWVRLRTRVKEQEGAGAIPDLPFGTLRDQMSNWLGSDENQAVLASTALAHGIPHTKDKLLYRHYSNRPWARLFQAQQEYRKVLQPMFDIVSDPLEHE